jgi:hypothetical protein
LNKTNITINAFILFFFFFFLKKFRTEKRKANDEKKKFINKTYKFFIEDIKKDIFFM